MITHVIVELDAPIEEKYWQDDDIFSNEYYGRGKPLIRCKNCKYYLKSNEVCGLIKTRLRFYEEDKKWFEDSFCAWAERKEEQ